MSRHDVGPVFDPGLQLERTSLAWRRTGLALAVGALVALRVLPVVGDSPWLFLLGGAGLIVAVALLVLAQRRYRCHYRLLSRTPPGPIGGGAIMMVTTAAVALLAAAALVLTLVR